MILSKRRIIATSGHHACVAAALVCLCAGVAGEENEHREHDAHAHGHGSLDVVADADELVIELRIPAVNVVGFEHEPSTEAQRQAVEAAIADFQSAEKLFIPSKAAKCRAEEIEVELAGLEHHDGEKHAEHEKEKEQHDEETHSELHAVYHFHCEAPGRLEHLDVRVFDYLDEAEELAVRIITSGSQSATELHPGEAVLMLDGS